MATANCVFIGFWCALALSQPAAAQSAKWKLLVQEAGTLYRQGKYDRAALVVKKVLELAERELGSEHPAVGTALNNLAMLYKPQGQYAAAEPLHKRSLAIREKALGPEHPDVATSLESIPELYTTRCGGSRSAHP